MWLRRDEVDSLLFIHAKIHRISICVLQPHIRPNESFDSISHMHTHKVPAFNLQCIIQMNLLNKYRAFVFSLCFASTGKFSAVFERYLIVLSSIKLPRMCVTHAHIWVWAQHQLFRTIILFAVLCCAQALCLHFNMYIWLVIFFSLLIYLSSREPLTRKKDVVLVVYLQSKNWLPFKAHQTTFKRQAN